MLYLINQKSEPENVVEMENYYEIWIVRHLWNPEDLYNPTLIPIPIYLIPLYCIIRHFSHPNDLFVTAILDWGVLYECFKIAVTKCRFCGVINYMVVTLNLSK